MNKKQIVASLSDIANTLDTNGLYTEASSITKVMTKIAQSNFVVNRFLQIHPQLQQEIDRLKLSKPGAGLVDISDIYTNNRYWNMPSSIDEKDITTRIKQLQNPEYQKSLAQKRLKFISDKLENERLSESDRMSLVNDLNYLKQFTASGSLSNNPELNPKKPAPQTAYDAMQNRGQSVLDSMKPKTPDYNQLVYNIVFKKIKQKNPQKSDTEIGLSLSNKTNLQGYKDISKNGNFVREILDEIEMYSKKYLNAEEINTILSKIFIDKISFSGVR
jgi:hypothetical protein